jgi:hypothetical protein
VQIYLQAADITSQVLNFGLSAPIDVQFQGRDAYSSYKLAVELLPKVKTIPGAVDVRIPETFDYPTLRVNIDRAKALQLGISENLAAALMGGFAITIAGWLTVLSFAPLEWLDGISPWIYCLATMLVWWGSAEFTCWSVRRGRQHRSSITHAH